MFGASGGGKERRSKCDGWEGAVQGLLRQFAGYLQSANQFVADVATVSAATCGDDNRTKAFDLGDECKNVCGQRRNDLASSSDEVRVLE
jgi:hypothetical protein